LNSCGDNSRTDKASIVKGATSPSDVIQEKPVSTMMNPVQDKQEYSVYSALVNKYAKSFKGGQIVIDELTSGLNVIPSFPGNNNLSGFDKDGRFNKECVKSLKDNNMSVWKLSKDMLLVKEYFLVANQLEQIDSDMRSGIDGWKNYYGRYPNSQGLLSLSRAGFCKDKTQALVYIANRFSADGGWGRLVFLKVNADKQWQVVEEIVLWIS
jgi:hypothetical protein